MAGEKYIVAASDNPSQIAVRNILNPAGYVFLGNCGDPLSLMRLIRTYHPDFAVIDAGLKMNDIRNTVETIDEEMLCACILIGEYKDEAILNIMDNSKIIMFCPRPVGREMLVHTVNMANINFKRILELNTKLREMTENYETRKSVERAKWILINRDGMSEKDAYDRLRKKSMDSRLPLKTVADAIITAYEVMNK